MAVFEGGFAGSLDEVVEVGDEGIKVEVVWWCWAGGFQMSEGFLPVILEF
jgi:hypothetical protein